MSKSYQVGGPMATEQEVVQSGCETVDFCTMDHPSSRDMVESLPKYQSKSRNIIKILRLIKLITEPMISSLTQF